MFKKSEKKLFEKFEEKPEDWDESTEDCNVATIAFPKDTDLIPVVVGDGESAFVLTGDTWGLRVLLFALPLVIFFAGYWAARLFA